MTDADEDVLTSGIYIGVSNKKVIEKIALEAKKDTTFHPNMITELEIVRDTLTSEDSVLKQVIGVYLSVSPFANELRCEKPGLRGFRPGLTQTGLCSHRRWLEA